MGSKILLKQALWIVASLGFTLFTVLFWNFISKDSTEDSSMARIENNSTLPSDSVSLVKKVTTLPKKEQVIDGSPVRLKISSVGIDSAIIQVGLTSDGAIGVPEGPADVAWFNLGPRPGEIGSAIIVGHSGWKDNIQAVFDSLYMLRIGDKISVEDDRGLITTFVVREIKTYTKDETVPDIFNSNDKKAHLNLITCIGDWNNAEKTRLNRLVVFTDKE